jgi:hypothetical protein
MDFISIVCWELSLGLFMSQCYTLVLLQPAIVAIVSASPFEMGTVWSYHEINSVFLKNAMTGFYWMTDAKIHMFGSSVFYAKIVEVWDLNTGHPTQDHFLLRENMPFIITSSPDAIRRGKYNFIIDSTRALRNKEANLPAKQENPAYSYQAITAPLAASITIGPRTTPSHNPSATCHRSVVQNPPSRWKLFNCNFRLQLHQDCNSTGMISYF